MAPESFDGNEWDGCRIATLGMAPLAPGISAASQLHFRRWRHTPASTVLLGIRARSNWFLMSICFFQFLWGFQFLFFCEGQAFRGKKRNPLSLTCSAVSLRCLLINFGQVWPSCGIPIQHSASREICCLDHHLPKKVTWDPENRGLFHSQ